jgi:uncharacterized protein YqeY
MDRQPKKELTDDEVIKILKKLRKYEVETLQAQGFSLENTTSSFLMTIDEYLPKEADAKEIEAWIINNISFSNYSNKMQAMKPIMAYFGSRADGKLVKEILEKIK